MTLSYNRITKEEDAKRNLIDKGDYAFQVLEFTDGMTRSGAYPMFTMEFKFWDNNGKERTRKDWFVMMEGMEWKFRHLCETLGLIDLYDQNLVKKEDIWNKTGHFRMGIKKNKESGSEENYVADYITEDKVKKIAKPVEQEAFHDDEIPF